MLALGAVAILLLVLANAFFVLGEFSLITVDRGRVEELAQSGDRRARGLLVATTQLTRHLSAAQFGITVASILIGFVAEPLVAGVLHPLLNGLPVVEEDLALAVSIAVSLILSTYLQMVIGEQVPKAVAIARPLQTGLLVIQPLRAFAWVLGPPISLLNSLADAVVRRFGVTPRSELTAARSIEELEVVIRESAAHGTLSRETARLLSRAIRFPEKTALDAMRPRPQVVTVPGTATVATMLTAAAESGHTGIPVRGSNPEDLVGVVRVEDALAVPPSERRTSTVSAIVRPTFVVPESKDLLSLISEMRRHQSQLVAVIDEYGGLAGIVTDEDLLEEIVGEIDEGRPGTRVEREPGMVPGWAGEEQVLEETGFTIPPGEGAYETLAGFLLSTLGHIPSVGEVVEVEGWRFEITQLDEHRIAWVRVHRPRAEGTAGRG